MKKNLFILCFCFLAVIIINPLLKGADPVTKPIEQPMLAAFQASQAVFTEVKLQGWAKINQKFCSIPTLEEYADQVERIMEPSSPLARYRTTDAGFSSLEMKGEITEGLSAEVIFQSLCDGDEENETYLIVNIVDSRGPGNMPTDREKLLNGFREFERVPDMNQLVVGYLKGKLPPKKGIKVIETVFESVGGKINAGVEEASYLSKTGFVPNLHESVLAGSDKTNLQVAMSYNEIEDKTYIYIGTPLVYGDY